MQVDGAAGQSVCGWWHGPTAVRISVGIALAITVESQLDLYYNYRAALLQADCVALLQADNAALLWAGSARPLQLHC